MAESAWAPWHRSLAGKRAARLVSREAAQAAYNRRHSDMLRRVATGDLPPYRLRDRLRMWLRRPWRWPPKRPIGYGTISFDSDAPWGERADG